ncbi:universal stress protein [Rhodococcus opacus]|uniref:universal stress protein n=1 Tax=Rhodococcus opacus TaxID=37919 RepID=UPI001F578199|nr:universal stress protein [Rhodococcus opacus]MDX5964969.1 universal stress protein [Rhodococcus opacus]UNN01555.1 universal stress protein [Rhodococcus opacus]UZG52476.1 universal stress protein [Rhodococcus opacus]
MFAVPPRQVLVATDLSDPAGRAVRRAAQLAGQHGARVTALHVLPMGVDSNLTEFAYTLLRSHGFLPSPRPSIPSRSATTASGRTSQTPTARSCTSSPQTGPSAPPSHACSPTTPASASSSGTRPATPGYPPASASFSTP